MSVLITAIPKIATTLSNDSYYHFLRICLLLTFFVVTRKIFFMKGDVAVYGYFNKTKITFFLRYITDVAVLREVFVLNEYEWCPIEPAVIVDLGAHFGDTTLYYHARFPHARIIAVEPSPENYERLVKHTSSISQITAVQAAIGGIVGEVPMSLGKATFGHSLFSREANAPTVMVRQTTLPLILKECDVTKADLVKFDIEGAEFAMFKSISAKSLSQLYIGELHFDICLQTTNDYLKTFEDMEITLVDLPQKNRAILRVGPVDLIAS